jgi:ABC-type oligopeptide transport system ATPase subunit
MQHGRLVEIADVEALVRGDVAHAHTKELLKASADLEMRRVVDA